MAAMKKNTKTSDPVTRIMEMAQAGDASKITTSMLKEALDYSKQKDRELAKQSKADKTKK
jgi:hypothetical protein